MKKLFALLLLPSIAFAGKIGENYVGVELGSTNIDFGYNSSGNDSVASDANGFSWSISGNYNIYQPSSEQYGVDLTASYSNGSGDDSAKNTKDDQTWTIDSEISSFVATIRPHYDFAGFKVFLDLGLLYLDLESVIKNPSTTTAAGDSTEFLYGVGFELDLGDKFSLQPSINWSETPNLKTTSDTYVGKDTLSFNIPISYTYSDRLDITASFSAINNDDFAHSANTSTSFRNVKSESSSWGLGIDYKF